MQSSIIETVKQQAADLFSGAPGSHDWEHTLRVVRLCRHIGSREHVDMTALLAAAYLHDIGRCHTRGNDGAMCHAEKGAEMAAGLLASLPLSSERRGNILHAIRAHRYRGETAPASMEARVLFDADKLDAIGAVGVARAYLFAGELGAALHLPDVPVTELKPYSREDTGYREYMVKLRYIHQRMLTDEGRRLACERHAFMKTFFDRFLQEMEGGC
jgi:uncharacterized protein